MKKEDFLVESDYLLDKDPNDINARLIQYSYSEKNLKEEIKKLKEEAEEILLNNNIEELYFDDITNYLKKIKIRYNYLRKLKYFDLFYFLENIEVVINNQPDSIKELFYLDCFLREYNYIKNITIDFRRFLDYDFNIGLYHHVKSRLKSIKFLHNYDTHNYEALNFIENNKIEEVTIDNRCGCLNKLLSSKCFHNIEKLTVYNEIEYNYNINKPLRNLKTLEIYAKLDSKYLNEFNKSNYFCNVENLIFHDCYINSGKYLDSTYLNLVGFLKKHNFYNLKSVIWNVKSIKNIIVLNNKLYKHKDQSLIKLPNYLDNININFNLKKKVDNEIKRRNISFKK